MKRVRQAGVREASSGHDALDLVAAGWVPDAVLMDLAMPGIDGWETCERIHAMPGLNGLRIYMVTAKPMDRSLAQVKAAGAAGYMMKPFKAEDLRALVEGYEWRQAVSK